MREKNSILFNIIARAFYALRILFCVRKIDNLRRKTSLIALLFSCFFFWCLWGIFLYFLLNSILDMLLIGLQEYKKSWKKVDESAFLKYRGGSHPEIPYMILFLVLSPLGKMQLRRSSHLSLAREKLKRIHRLFSLMLINRYERNQ